MAVTGKVYFDFLRQLAEGDNVLPTDAVKAMIINNSYTPNQITDVAAGTVDANEVSGSGYTAGGKTITSPALNPDTGGIRYLYDGADLVWSAVTFTNGRYLVLYLASGDLICYFDFGTNVTMSGGTFTITWDVNGILAILTA